MGQGTQQLSGTFRPGTADMRSVLIPDHRGPAHRADCGELIGLGPLRALAQHQRDNLRDDLPRFLDQYRVPYPNVLFCDIVLVVQGGVGHSGPSQAYRADHRLWGKHPSAAYLHYDLLHYALLLLWRILVGGGPAGKLRCFSKSLTCCKVI